MQNIYWDLLKKNREKSKDRRIETLFQSDKNRFKEFAIEIEDLYFDYSKTNIDSETLKNLIAYAKNLKIMDIAAGSLIVKEAGGSVTDFEGKENYLNSGRIVASNFSIHDEMLKNINTKF